MNDVYWRVGFVANVVVAVAYLLIALAIVVPLVRSRQLGSNRLATATAAIFFTCAIHHGGHPLHMLLPAFGAEVQQGLAMRQSYDLSMALWDIVTAAVGVYYWTLRRAYGSLTRGAQLFEDVRQREQQALELNDNVLQGLVVAKLALELGERERADAALEASIAAASTMITKLLVDGQHSAQAGLLRSTPALTEGGKT
ncbi:MAG: hypothetical protein ACTHMZ_00780 [Actinomycetes bacterium]